LDNWQFRIFFAEDAIVFIHSFYFAQHLLADFRRKLIGVIFSKRTLNSLKIDKQNSKQLLG